MMSVIFQRRMLIEKSEYKSYDDLPLFLNAEIVAKVLAYLHRRDMN